MLKLDYSRDSLLDEFAIATLRDRYMVEGETSPQEAFARAAMAFADDEAHAQRLYDYASQLWFMFSTPVLSNGGTQRGLPISCFLNYVDDSREGITEHYVENAYLSSFGGGIGGTWSEVRSQGTKTSKGSESTGIIPFIGVVDREMLAFSQGVTRRGSYAAYLRMDHPEIEEFLDVRKPTGGDHNRKSTNLHHGVVIPDRFMELIHTATRMDNFDDSWDLIDPHTKRVVKTVSARALWVKLLQNRMETGEPYLMFEDAVQSNLPEFQKNLGLKVHHSNLCSEITLPTNEERTAVCCLSSVNLEYFDDWKDHPHFIGDLITMLDNVVQHYIDNAIDVETLGGYNANYKRFSNHVNPDKKPFTRSAFSAYRERSLGLGAMGFHAYLQKNNIPFESMFAASFNNQAFKHIKTHAKKASKFLAEIRGEAPDVAGTGLRNAHLLAVAPNASSSIICGGTSPSIEPYRANVFTHKTLTGSYQVKNKHLEKVLKSKGLKAEEINNLWKDIFANNGSVQHLDILDDNEKEIFKTANEINQIWIIEHAHQRQEYICQSQSVNLFFTLPKATEPQEVHDEYLQYINDVHWAGMHKLKSLYYLRSDAARAAENVNIKIPRIKLDEEGCIACEG